MTTAMERKTSENLSAMDRKDLRCIISLGLLSIALNTALVIAAWQVPSIAAYGRTIFRVSEGICLFGLFASMAHVAGVIGLEPNRESHVWCFFFIGFLIAEAGIRWFL